MLANVLLEFFELGDNFKYLAANGLFATPLIYVFPNGGLGFDTNFKALTQDFTAPEDSSIFTSASPATRQGLASFLAQMP